MAYEVVVGRNEKDKEKYGTKGCLLLGKHYVKMGQTSSLSNEVWMDVSRSHVVFLCGKRGSGKCLHEDTLITLEDGRLVPIKDLEHETARPLGLNTDLKVAPLSREGFYKRTVKKLLKLKLRSGKEIRLTPEHPLLTVRGWVSAQNLTMNDRIATPRRLACSTNSSLSDNQVKFLAYILAEGHIGKNILEFTNFDQMLVNEFTEITQQLDDNARIVQARRGSYRVYNKKKNAIFQNYKEMNLEDSLPQAKSGINEHNFLNGWIN